MSESLHFVGFFSELWWKDWMNWAGSENKGCPQPMLYHIQMHLPKLRVLYTGILPQTLDLAFCHTTDVNTSDQWHIVSTSWPSFHYWVQQPSINLLDWRGVVVPSKHDDCLEDKREDSRTVLCCIVYHTYTSAFQAASGGAQCLLWSAGPTCNRVHHADASTLFYCQTAAAARFANHLWLWCVINVAHSYWLFGHVTVHLGKSSTDSLWF